MREIIKSVIKSDQDGRDGSILLPVRGFGISEETSLKDRVVLKTTVKRMAQTGYSLQFTKGVVYSSENDYLDEQSSRKAQATYRRNGSDKT